MFGENNGLFAKIPSPSLAPIEPGRLASNFGACWRLVLICFERMASWDAGMFGLQETLRWAGLYLVHSLKVTERKATVHSLQCFGQIFVEQGDDDTALSLFRLALEEFSSMDIHRWRADCMLRMAEIFERRADISKSVQLWRTARSLFERCSQAKSVAQVDAKLASVDPAFIRKLDVAPLETRMTSAHLAKSL
ncbi:hypothetical protein B0H11DRAFT_1939621 [Mycena galericulata]|nr:hypothetical protein B0H11DRAFT_1939621 [Mycena galericulata]